MLLDGNGWCNRNMTTMEGATATQGQRNGDDKWSDENMTTMMATNVMTATATAMDDTTATAMEGATAMRRQQQQWKA